MKWDIWLGQAPKVPYTEKPHSYEFRYWLEYSGGDVTNWGVHHSDIAIWALGGENSGASEVEGKGEFPLGRELMLATLLGKKPFEALPACYNAATAYNCTMTLPNGNTINLTSGDDYDLLIKGELGHLAVRRSAIRGNFVKKLKQDPEEKQWLDAEVRKLYRGKPLRGHMANFLACVQDRSLPISDVYTHVNSVNACHMANIAMLLGRKVRWDLKQQQFIDNAEANALMSRPRAARRTRCQLEGRGPDRHGFLARQSRPRHRWFQRPGPRDRRAVRRRRQQGRHRRPGGRGGPASGRPDAGGRL